MVGHRASLKHQSNNAPLAKNEMVVGSAISQRRRVLIVEDEPFIASLLADQMTELGYTVIGPAFSLDQARGFATASHIDLALLDFSLHGKCADEIADIFIARQIPFLFVTGYDELSFPKYHDVPLLMKPFEIGALQRAIEALLSGG